MDLTKIIAFLKQEWNQFNYLRAANEEKLRSEDDLAKSFFKEILGANFFILLVLATAIATFGLLSNSAATIIGAMIIAPLMVPIMSLAFSLVMLDFRLVSYSLVKLVLGVKPVHLKIRVFPIDIIDYEVAAPSTGYK
ncbi:MAG: DUF389 domain-containing protein [Xenococcus sp. MO_188.B8]|nr:DUF389 domain-containing protein [Xenococcus sp. MO_188.B8]